MVSNCQDLNHSIHFAVDKVKVKHFEHGTPNVRRRNNAKTLRRSTNRSQNTLKFGVVSLAQSRLYLFVVSDLLLVFFGSLRVEPIAHFNSA